MPDLRSDICLGTVKLGVPDYGFSARKTAETFDPAHFLRQVEATGIYCFDTSPRYGRSEEILGAYFLQTDLRPLVSSKIDDLMPGEVDTPQKMLLSVQSSLQRLNLSHLDICYLHQNELEIISDPYVHEGLMLLKEQRLINAAGASVYTHAECDYALESKMFEVIQVPVSVFDLGFYQRFIKNNRSKVRFVARSLLLQGILADTAGVAMRIRPADQVRNYLRQLDHLAKAQGLTTIAMALGFVGSLPGIDKYLFGTTSVWNLRQNIQSINRGIPQELLTQVSELASKPKVWTNPRHWGW